MYCKTELQPEWVHVDVTAESQNLLQRPAVLQNLTSEQLLHIMSASLGPWSITSKLGPSICSGIRVLSAASELGLSLHSSTRCMGCSCESVRCDRSSYLYIYAWHH